MKQYGRSLPAKVFGVFLFMLLAAFCLALGGAALYMYDQSYYDVDVQDYTQTGAYFQVTHRYASIAYDYYQNGRNPQEPGGVLAQSSTNFAYELAGIYKPDQVLAYNYHSGKTEPDFTFQFGSNVVRCYVRDPLEAVDDYAESKAAFDRLYPYRFTALFWLGIGAVGLCAVLVYLLCATGRRPGTDEVALNLQDRIPLDLYLVAAVTVVLCLLIFPLDHLALRNVFEVAVLGIFLTACIGVGLATLLTLAARFKAGKWWRNTLLYRFLFLLRRAGGFLLRAAALLLDNLPIIWKFGAVYLGVQFLNFLLAYWYFDWGSGGAFLLGALFNLLVLGALGYVALALQKLKDGARRLAVGDLDYKLDDRRLLLDLGQHARDLNRISDGMAGAVNQRMRSERLKTELITNVSHDIKTPLTSIINYVDLLQKEEIPGVAGEYVEVLDRQSKRLKKLTEDLVEASKASTGNLPVELAPTGLCELVRQSAGEYAERFAAVGLDAVVSAPEGEVRVLADGKYLWRVLDNLLGNVCKYSLPGTRVYIDVAEVAGEAAVTVKNISRSQLNIDSEELMERFVRGDSARSTEGSGLGLNIARSLVELQGGWFQLSIDGDLFKAEARFPRMGA